MSLSLDPEYLRSVQPWLEKLANAPKFPIGDVMSRRNSINRMMPSLLAQLDPVDDVEVSSYIVPAADGYEIPLYHFTKKDYPTPSPAPAIVYTHGGEFFCLSVDVYTPLLKIYVSMSGHQIFAMDYRLPPEHPFPTPIEDCYTALKWVSENAAKFDVDPARIAIMGDSAGGGLCAGTAICARDRELSPPLAKQIIIHANLDDRNTKEGAHPALAPFATWDQDSNITGWQAYLGDKAGKDGVSPWAAPARLEDVKGLPPTYVDVPYLDILRDEDIAYAAKIAAADIDTELHVYPNVPHSFECFAPQAGLAKTALMNRVRAMSTF